ncbi:glycosyltransferase [Micrococcus sp.]|uniref:glycosyltransferase n=1 Tax=Micrococcus sp. TaxID=1271 RepID=UPI002A91F279|nr:glycosyltransferase [Micrococcus sp.]MDY6054288.1 glycosyltransferase [Micrococcus sp.]
MRHLDETALWTSRATSLIVRHRDGTVTVHGLAPACPADPDGAEQPSIVDEQPAPDVDAAPAPEGSWRLRHLNSGLLREVRRRLYHARRAPARQVRARLASAVTSSGRWTARTRDRVRSLLTSAQDRRASTPVESEPAVARPSGPAAGAPSLAERRAAWAEQADAAALLPLIKALYDDGALREPRDLILAHPELVAEGSAGQRRLAASIVEQARLLDAPPAVPARGAGPAHRPERGRILYCAHGVHPYQSNGYAIRTRGIVGGLRDAGHDVVVAARPGFPWDAASIRRAPKKHSFAQLVDGIEHVFSYGPSLKMQALASYLETAVDAYSAVIARQRPERVHAASNHITALPALIAARLAGVPFTYEVRGFWEYGLAEGQEGVQERRALATVLEDLVMAEADHVCVLTAEMRDELVTRGVPAERLTVTPNGVDPEQFQPLPAVGEVHRRLGLDPDRAVVGYVGSFVDYEGLDDLVEACLRLADEREDFQLVLAGDGPALPRIQETLRERGQDLEHRVLGRIPADDIPALLAEVDIVACPRVSTPVTRLVSPLKPLEALASGIPVVLSDLPVLTSLREECGGAVTFPAGDVAALAGVLGDLLDDPERRGELGRAGRAWAVQRRRWDVLGAQLAEAVLAAGADVDAADTPQARPLDQIRVGLIADTFTTSTLALQTRVTVLDRTRWREQLDAEPLDLVFVESAWSGNDGQWTRGVGHYSDEESADLRALVASCRERGVPTVFWNKEDPVHFARFIDNAALFDLVLTTDNRSIPRYLARTERGRQQVASLPFFAHPALHHPVTEAPAVTDRPVMYAGSYYGDRYKDRSAVLEMLLDAARPHGVTIFDRQADLPDSPYRFPEALQPFVEGGLPYSEMVRAYRRYPVHVNVNSVTESETMFSRRVVEIGCSGGVVASGPSAAVNHMFRGLVPTIGRKDAAGRAFDAVLADPELRNVQGWNLRRMIRRSHTLEHRLLPVLRRLGVPVRATGDPCVRVRLTGDAAGADWTGLAAQTLPVAEVVAEGSAVEALQGSGIRVLSAAEAASSSADVEIEWTGQALDRVVVEDVVEVLVDAGLGSVSLDTAAVTDLGTPLVSTGAPEPEAPLVRARRTGADGPHAVLRRGLLAERIHGSAVAAVETAPRPLRVVVAGHDLKFAGELMDRLRADGHEVRVDQWASHQDHDEEASTALLEWAEVVVCEWGLGNAVWYSTHVRPEQGLIVRVHSQELFRPWLSRMRLAAVDRFVYVAPHIRDAARRFRGVGARPDEVIPNIVRPGAGLPRDPESRFVLGLVGVVPRGKRLDRALDVLARLRARDERFTLRVKGRMPADYPWMLARAEEMAFYEEQWRRIAEDPHLEGAVHLDGFSSDRAELERWYASIGVALSVSDFESFHFTVADGAMNGAVPAVLAWPGADRLFPDTWLHASTEAIAEDVLALADPEVFAARSAQAAAEVAERFDGAAVLDRWSALVREVAPPEPTPEPTPGPVSEG